MGLYIPYRGTLTEPGHDVANKRITTIVTAVTAETDLPDLTVSFDQLNSLLLLATFLFRGRPLLHHTSQVSICLVQL